MSSGSPYEFVKDYEERVRTTAQITLEKWYICQLRMILHCLEGWHILARVQFLNHNLPNQKRYFKFGMHH